VMVRYFGLYANAHRGKVKKASQSPTAFRIVEEELRRLPSKGWAAMIRKVYEVDPMVCPKCGGDDEDHRFHHGVCRCGPDYRSLEAEVL